jgi:hypothetical protein
MWTRIAWASTLRLPSIRTAVIVGAAPKTRGARARKVPATATGSSAGGVPLAAGGGSAGIARIGSSLRSPGEDASQRAGSIGRRGAGTGDSATAASSASPPSGASASSRTAAATEGSGPTRLASRSDASAPAVIGRVALGPPTPGSPFGRATPRPAEQPVS